MKRMVMISGIFLILTISFISAGLLDFLNPSGRASSAPQDVSVTVSGSNAPTIPYVQDLTSVSPTESAITTVVFEVHVSDADGVGNIDDASVNAQIKRGAVTRSGTCPWVNDINANTANYSCSVNMQYYDEAGDWTINVSAEDQENNLVSNSNEFFSYSELKAFQVPLSPSTLSWPTLTPGALNVLSDNDPTTVTNTGNYRGNLYVRGYDLQGESNGAESILSTTFSIAGVSGSECAGTSLGSDGVNTDTSIFANPGPSGSNNAFIYYCLDVPLVSSQVYSTSIRGVSWVISYN